MIGQGFPPDEILVRGALVLGRGAKRGEEFLAVPDREDRVGVTGVDGEQHGSASSEVDVGRRNAAKPVGRR